MEMVQNLSTKTNYTMRSMTLWNSGYHSNSENRTEKSDIANCPLEYALCQGIYWISCLITELQSHVYIIE